VSPAFPKNRSGRLPASFRERDFSRGRFRDCSYFLMFRPPSLLASRIAPTAVSFPTGQLRRSHPSRTRVVAFARIGYAIGRLQAISRTGTLTPLDSRFCRLLPIPIARSIDRSGRNEALIWQASILSTTAFVRQTQAHGAKAFAPHWIFSMDRWDRHSCLSPSCFICLFSEPSNEGIYHGNLKVLLSCI
jgi:hypothetical protein